MLKLKSTVMVAIITGTLVALGNSEEKANERPIVIQLSKLASIGGASFVQAPGEAIGAGVAESNGFATAWLKRHGESILGTDGSPFPAELPFGVATQNGRRLYLHLQDIPDNRTIQVPRLHNSVTQVWPLGSRKPKGKLENLTPGVSMWDIKLPSDLRIDDLPVVVVELDAKPRVASETIPVVRASEKKNETILLHSRYAEPHGKMLRFEPQPHKNCVGYWVEENDWVEWRCVARKPGDYDVLLRYGCGNNQGGSLIEISAETKSMKQRLEFSVVATGGFQAWRDVKVGSFKLPADREITIAVRPQKKAKQAVMDIRHITLQPK